MGNRQGRDVGLYIGIENSYGAGQTSPSMYRIPRSTLRMSPVYTQDVSPEIQSNPNPTMTVRSTIDHQGEFAHVATCDAAALLLYVFCGNDTISGTTAPYSHISKIASNAMKSLVVEKYDTNNVKGDYFLGVVLTSLAITWKKDKGPLILTFGAQGIGAAMTRNSATQYDTTPATFTDLRLAQMATVLQVDATTTLNSLITEFTAKWTWEAFAQNGLTGTAYADGMDLGACKIESSFKARRPAADTIYALANDAEHTFTLKCTRPGASTRYIQVDFPEAKVEKQPTDESAAGPVEETYNVYPYYNDNADATATKFTVLNDQASYT